MALVYVVSRESIQIDESSTWDVQGVYSTADRAQDHARLHIKLPSIGWDRSLGALGFRWSTRLLPPQVQWRIEEFFLDGPPEPLKRDANAIRKKKSEW